MSTMGIANTSAIPLELAVTAMFNDLRLRFINRYHTIIGSKGALTDRTKSSALFYCRNCLLICLALMDAPVTYDRHSNKFAAIVLRRGQRNALAFFLEARR